MVSLQTLLDESPLAFRAVLERSFFSGARDMAPELYDLVAGEVAQALFGWIP